MFEEARAESVAADVDASVPLKHVCHRGFSCSAPLRLICPHQPGATGIFLYHLLSPPTLLAHNPAAKCLKCCAERGENFSWNILSWLCLLSADRSSLVSPPSIFLLLTASEPETRGFPSVEQQELISGSQQPQTGAALCFFFLHSSDTLVSAQFIQLLKHSLGSAQTTCRLHRAARPLTPEDGRLHHLPLCVL